MVKRLSMVLMSGALTVLSALEREERLSHPSAPLIQELELALYTLVTDDLKYGGSPEDVWSGLQDLGELETLPESLVRDLGRIVPPAFRDRICRDGKAGRTMRILKETLCS